MNNLKLVMLCIITLLLIIPIAGATYDVVSNISSNSTEYTTSASYVELHNITLATGAGTTFLIASWDARVNRTAPLYGRFLRDGVSLGRFNLTQDVYATVGSYQISLAETTGTHYYGWEVYSNQKGTIYSRNFSAFFLVNGSYGTGAGGGNVSSVIGAPAGVLESTGTDEVTITITQAATGASGYLSSTDWNIFNSKITNATAQINRSQVSGQEGIDTTQNTSISNSQSNDTYFNGSYFPNSTNFRNNTLQEAINTKEPTISSSTASKFYGWDKTFKDILISYISGLQGALDAMNTSSATNNTASQGRDDAQNISIDALLINAPNTTVAGTINCSALGIDYVSKFNGTTWECYEVTGTGTNFTINATGQPAIPDYATLINGTNITISQAGHELTISSSGVAVSEHELNGTLHTGSLKYSRIDNVLIDDVNISSAATWNAKTTLTEVNTSALLNSTAQVTGLDTALSGKESTITGSTNNVFWNGVKQWISLTTANVTEGASGLYFTAARVRANVSNGTSTNLTYSSTTGIFDLSFPVCSNGTTSKLLSTSTGVYCGTDQNTGTSSGGGGINVSGQPVITANATLVEGANITLSQSGNNITIASTGSSQTVNFDLFTGDGSTKNFTTTDTILVNSSRVYVNGIRQLWNQSYTEKTKSVNFTTAPGSGYAIEVEYTAQ